MKTRHAKTIRDGILDGRAMAIMVALLNVPELYAVNMASFNRPAYPWRLKLYERALARGIDQGFDIANNYLLDSIYNEDEGE